MGLFGWSKIHGVLNWISKKENGTYPMINYKTVGRTSNRHLPFEGSDVSSKVEIVLDNQSNSRTKSFVDQMIAITRNPSFRYKHATITYKGYHDDSNHNIAFQ
jgi:hypothetical protein